MAFLGEILDTTGIAWLNIFMNWFIALVCCLFLPNIAWSGQCKNGLYIGPSWLTKAKSSAEFSTLIKRLQDAHVGNVFINTSGISLESSLANGFIKNLKSNLPDVKVIGMAVRSPCKFNSPDKSKCFDPSSESARDSLTADVKGVLNFGFDGVQLDFEPVPSGDKNFLGILDQVRKVTPPGKILSIAGYFLELDGKDKQELVPTIQGDAHGDRTLLTWSRKYYSDAMSKVDQVMLMNYDTALRSAKDYSRFTEWQTRQLMSLAAKSKVDLQIGLPSDMKGREGLYDRSAENLVTGISGVQAAIGQSGCPIGVGGVTIFNDASMNPALWNSFDGAFGATRGGLKPPAPEDGAPQGGDSDNNVVPASEIPAESAEFPSGH